jgi:hypothetical protein
MCLFFMREIGPDGDWIREVEKLRAWERSTRNYILGVPDTEWNDIDECVYREKYSSSAERVGGESQSV